MRYAVLDVETTGFGRTDRLVETAVVVLDENLQTIEEFDTLLNPRRDVGPTGIHGVTASMIATAPTFDEVGGAIAERISGCVLVAHNLPFDVRMLAQEFARLGGELSGGVGFDTLRYTGCTLDVACASFGVPLRDHHRALADAHATADLMRALYEEGETFAPATVLNAPASAAMRTLRREAVQVGLRAMVRIRPPMRFPTGDGPMLAYLHSLNWMLDDAVIDQAERQELDALALDLGLDPVATTQMHSHYLRQLVSAATRDGVVTSEERLLLERVAHALGVDDSFLPTITVESAPPLLVEGMRVCFTGDAERWTRAELEIAAARAGFQPVGDVTKKPCDLLVAADTGSQSGKAARARRWGIPIVPISEFVERISLD